MNIEELFRSRFGPESARELGQVLGLESEQAARLLDRAVRSQLEAVAQQAKSEAGRAQVLDAIANLPRFRDVSHALTEQGGAASLQLAGELLSPALLGHDQTDLAGQLSRVEGAPQPSITALMNMSLPLLLSFIGQAGVNGGNITQVMSTIRASGVRPRSAGGSYVSRAAAANAPQFVDGGQGQAAGEIKKSPEPASAPAPTPVSGQAPAAQAEAGQPEPELAQDTDYSKSSVVSALLDGAEVPEPGAVQRESQPQAPAASLKENPYRSEEEAQDAAPQPEPELAQDTDYSKSSVVSALLDGAEAPAAAAQPAQPQADKPQPTAPQPGATQSSAAQATQPQAVPAQTQPAPSSPASSSPAASPAALAAAAAAAGVGAGAVRPAAPQAQPAGSPWKSAQPVVIGAQPSVTAARAAQPSAAAAATPTLASASGQDLPLTADSLVSYFREQFSAQDVGALAEAAGFGRRDAGRAVQGTAAVLLSALAQKGRDQSGAAELLALSGDFGRVAEGEQLNTALLGNRAELGALEVRGLSVLDRLLDNPGQVGGRLGTALGTSGEQAGRLLALLTPFVLGLLGSRARGAGLDAAGLSRVLGGLDAGRLESLLPEDLGVLKSLLGTQLFGAAPRERATLLETKQAKAAPVPVAAPAGETVVAAQPAPVQPMTPEPPHPVAPAQPERRGGFPWWLLLLLLAGLAWYLTQNRSEQPLPAPTEQTQIQTAPATTPTTGTFTVTEPAAGSSVAASGFTLSGTAEPSASYRLLQDGTEVGTFTSDADGRWSADVAAAPAGEHTYSVQTEGGAEVISLPLTLE
ncbi:hypothetical protein Deipr_0079 [Deinococcus proteolyticus MRP]|uniref:DUF937 domain-containing protein n=1 Tax=Deinococcus proteolyticus (strain ATCC 35074 / DSM 20540 / JCM 6276 / NBRC 101906 / NCIMB 13154 / VKM Ac-1939 / CCM 2703 / MRP) TaxID=693977 RepID=F0RNF3_DEIPM|nr:MULTISPECIES: DUF937 domain-containing protein [Deinococcus]ADY25255.1 hypothetical protein Deipr_0079 [Deinococcus proteolyticus MRP]MCY1703354.1 DUF937 domain-containing protein [Deinococcus sp. SL84]